MRQSTKPFVVERKKKWQPKREPGPLFSQEELLRAQAPEVAVSALTIVTAVPTPGVAEVSPTPRRILPDLTAAPRAFELKVTRNDGQERKRPVPLLEAQSSSDKPSEDAAVESMGEVGSVRPPAVTKVEAVPVAEGVGRGSARSKPKRQSHVTRKNSFSKMSLDELVELRDEVARMIEKKIAREQAQLQGRLRALTRHAVHRDVTSRSSRK